MQVEINKGSAGRFNILWILALYACVVEDCRGHPCSGNLYNEGGYLRSVVDAIDWELQ
jgi:hypothetical protein